MAQKLVLILILFLLIDYRILPMTYGFPRPNTRSWFQPNFYFSAINDHHSYDTHAESVVTTRTTTAIPVKLLGKLAYKGDPREFLG